MDGNTYLITGHIQEYEIWRYHGILLTRLKDRYIHRRALANIIDGLIVQATLVGIIKVDRKAHFLLHDDRAILPYVSRLLISTQVSKAQQSS